MGHLVHVQPSVGPFDRPRQPVPKDPGEAVGTSASARQKESHEFGSDPRHCGRRPDGYAGRLHAEAVLIELGAESLLGVPTMVTRSRVVTLDEGNLDEDAAARAESPPDLGQGLMGIRHVLKGSLEDDAVENLVSKRQTFGYAYDVDSVRRCHVEVDDSAPIVRAACSYVQKQTSGRE